MSEKQNLTDYRKEIDEIDAALVELYERRIAVAEKVGRYKVEAGMKVFDKDREAQKIASVSAMAHDSFNRHGIRELFAQLMSVSRKKQYAILEEKGAGGRLPFIKIKDLDHEKIRVVFQGEEGAYSHAAMCEYFGDDVNSFHVRSFRDAMEVIAEGAADYGVLPIENSSAGIVADNFDLLVDFENYIVAEQVIDVRHVLMAKPGTNMEEITKVCSHPQALAQCENFFAENRQMQPEPWGNTAQAAKMVSESDEKGIAAIGSAFAAKLYGLEILKDPVNDQKGNATRFMIVTNQRVYCEDADRISVCFELPHSSGTLYGALSNFIFNDVNMTHIESRPIPERNWEYRFFIDFEGSLEMPGVRNALRGIRDEAVNMKILGCYKVSYLGENRK